MNSNPHTEKFKVNAVCTLLGQAFKNTKRKSEIRHMNKLVLLLVAVSLFVASPEMSDAAIVSGKKLLLNCNTPETSVAQQNTCIGFISGTIDTNLAFIENKLIQPLFCPPNSVTLRQMKEIVVKFLESHPNNLHQSGSLLTTKALIEAFPCNKKTQPSK